MACIRRLNFGSLPFSASRSSSAAGRFTGKTAISRCRECNGLATHFWIDGQHLFTRFRNPQGAHMRIAYLTQSYAPMISGAAIAVEKLATGMAQHGHAVLVVAASDQEQPYALQQENLTLVRLNSTHNPLRVNQRFMRFPHFALLSALKKFEPDVIHVHEP